MARFAVHLHRLSQASDLTPQAVRILEGYKILPQPATRLVAGLLPYLEIVTGVLILLTPYIRVGAYMAGLFGVVFAVASISVLSRGINTSCGCSGSSSDRVTRFTVVRASVIAWSAWALLAVANPIEGAVGWVVFVLALCPAALMLLRDAARRRAARRGTLPTATVTQPGSAGPLIRT